MKFRPIIILFFLQIILFLAVALLIYVVNFIFKMSITLETSLFVLSMYPALVYTYQGLMKRFGIKSSDAILLTKFMVWLQIIPIVLVILIGYSVEKLTVQETIFLLVVGILVMFFLRFLGISMIKRIDSKN